MRNTKDELRQADAEKHDDRKTIQQKDRKQKYKKTVNRTQKASSRILMS